ncbi:alpha/beta hydrolase, partial [Pseudomonadota bacterium]
RTSWILICPRRLITRIDYPVREYVIRVRVPVLVAHSRHDEIIPFSMGQTIFDAALEPKSFLEMEGDHNAGFWISRDKYVPALDDFLTTLLGPYPVQLR